MGGNGATCGASAAAIPRSHSRRRSPPSAFKGFLLRQGKFAKFIMPNTQFNTIHWIIDNGQLSGNYVDLDGNPHGYIATRKHGRK